MNFNNNNSFNHNMNPYFTLTSFDSDNSNPAMYNMNQLYMPSWDIRLNMTHIPNLMTIIFKIISTHRFNGDSTPPSPIFNHLVHNFYSPILVHILLFLFHKLKKNLIWKGVWKPCLSPNNKFKI